MTSLVLAALAAALVADFKSFPIATAAGYVLGMSQTLVGRFWQQQGLDQSLPFLLIILMLVFRGRSIPLRDHYLRKLPAIGNGRISWDWMIFLAGVVVFLMLTKDTKWIDALTVTLCAVNRAAVDRRRHRLRRSALAGAVRDGRFWRVGRRPPRRRVPHPVPPRARGRRRRGRPARADLRTSGRPNRAGSTWRS